jgi:hypothetical protein
MPDGRVTVYPLEKLSAESRDRLAKLTPSLSLPYKLREVRREEDDGNSWQIGEAVSFVENFKFIVMQGEYFFRDLSESFSRSSIKGKLRATHSIAGFQSDSQVAFHQFKVPEEYAERLDGVFIKGSEGGLPIPLSNSEFFNLCFVNFVNGDNEIVHHGKFFSPCWGSIPSHGGYGTIRFAPWLLSGEDEDQPSYYAGGPICTTRMIFSLAYSVPSETLREVKHIRLEPARYGVIDPVSD